MSKTHRVSALLVLPATLLAGFLGAGTAQAQEAPAVPPPAESAGAQNSGGTPQSGYSPPPPAQVDVAVTDVDAKVPGVPETPVPPVGKVGIGYFTTAAPIGVRYWFAENMGFDVGVGFNISDTGPDADTTYGTAVEAGFLYALARLTNIVVFIRGGIGLDLSNLDGNDGIDVGFNINGLIGGEFFLTALGFPNLSFSGGVGLQVDLNSPDGGDFGFQFASANAPVDIVSAAVLGFHIYF